VQIKNRILLGLALISLIMGLVSQYFYPGADFPKSDIPFIIISLFLIFYWYHLDAIENNYRRSVFLNISVIFIAILALPYYFFRSRGFKKGFIATIGFLALAVLFNFLTLGGQYAVYYGLQT
jgi:hypothetical protein